MEIARRLQDIAPFRVMEILARGRALESSGRDVVHMEIGEPDFVSPPPVIEAAIEAQRAGRTHYTPAAGLPALRAAVADYYQSQLGVSVDPARVLITPGASGALQLVLGVLVNPGDRVLVTDPGYPCNRHMVSLFGGRPVGLPVKAESGYSVTVQALAGAMRQEIRALMLASPANPTGNLIGLGTIRDLSRQLSSMPGAMLICDEIYQGLQYGVPPRTALELDADNLVVINSFSKFFGMTGWRLGWVVAPEPMIEPMERLAQNIFLSPPTPSQYAALAAFSSQNLAILEQRRNAFEERRDYLFDAVSGLGFGLGEKPEGAFYLYADAARFTDDSMGFCRELLEVAGVAITPGLDFGTYLADRHVRFAYTSGLERLVAGVGRLEGFLRAGG